MKHTISLIAPVVSLVVGLLSLPACDSNKDAKPEAAGEHDAKDPKTPAVAPDAKAEDPKPTPEEAKPADADAVTIIGVAECDEYVKKMHDCFESDNVPAQMREAQRSGFDATVKTWSDAVKANPEAAPGLVAGCKAAMDAAAKSYPGCFSDAQ